MDVAEKGASPSEGNLTCELEVIAKRDFADFRQAVESQDAGG
jgi:hypothetical protein